MSETPQEVAARMNLEQAVRDEERQDRVFELARQRDLEAQAAIGLLYGTHVADPLYAGYMVEAVAHSNLALLYQAQLEDARAGLPPRPASPIAPHRFVGRLGPRHCDACDRPDDDPVHVWGGCGGLGV